MTGFQSSPRLGATSLYSLQCSAYIHGTRSTMLPACPADIPALTLINQLRPISVCWHFVNANLIFSGYNNRNMTSGAQST